MESLRGKLLIAGPTLVDPNFARSVVLILEHSEEGAMGLVLNRPVETTVDEAAPELADVVDGHEALFQGGPVQPSGVIVLAEFADPDDAAMLVVGGVGPLSASADLDAVQVVEGRARAFAGHAGWGPGQLESELERDDWFVEKARAEDAFASDAGRMWAAVLERKGGEYALVARMPDDPRVN
ncbi:MAG TPA: YqgE/AlgH family protein [Solirubrobacteraceae bacterium]|jgi:putative transcriptional regulator|nr:YqgE/AlgH family protein [Solirubrobacteraceae bacterium]